jgi:hypothetical protein
MPATMDNLRRLADLIDTVERRSGLRRGQWGYVPTGWEEKLPIADCRLPIETAGMAPESIGNLERGVLHEWFGPVGPGDSTSASVNDKGTWPALCVLAHLAGQACGTGGCAIVWVGRRCWPSGHLLGRVGQALGGQGELLRRSLFVDPPENQRLWVLDLLLRSPAVGVVAADGSGLPMAATRRLQLAAQVGGPLVLLARPAGELAMPSAAACRWLVRRRAGENIRGPAWTVELLRCKGLTKGDSPYFSSVRTPVGAQTTTTRKMGTVPTHWDLEWDHATGAVVISPPLVGGPARQTQPVADQHYARRA